MAGYKQRLSPILKKTMAVGLPPATPVYEPALVESCLIYIREKKAESIKALKDRLDPNALIKGSTFLELSIKEGDPPTVAAVLYIGASASGLPERIPPLHYAAGLGKIELFPILATHGASLSALYGEFELTATYMAFTQIDNPIDKLNTIVALITLGAFCDPDSLRYALINTPDNAQRALFILKDGGKALCNILIDSGDEGVAESIRTFTSNVLGGGVLPTAFHPIVAAFPAHIEEAKEAKASDKHGFRQALIVFKTVFAPYISAEDSTKLEEMIKPLFTLSNLATSSLKALPDTTLLGFGRGIKTPQGTDADGKAITVYSIEYLKAQKITNGNNKGNYCIVGENTPLLPVDLAQCI
jgi:hypothetical protein